MKIFGFNVFTPELLELRLIFVSYFSEFVPGFAKLAAGGPDREDCLEGRGDADISAAYLGNAPRTADEDLEPSGSGAGDALMRTSPVGLMHFAFTVP